MKKIISIKPDGPQNQGAQGPQGVSFKKFDKKKPAEDIVITEEMVYESLKGVHDPELPVNIVELGLVYDTQIS
ncbi:MAG: DUF59 domain-containing protein, partial [Candidatus Dadabacteria bacterium]|nr:DUF59 domain-containing protein [Candidatus Dadabacteria bacterium]